MKTNLLKLTFIALILLMGVSNAWAYNQSNVDLYFDNSTAKWTNCYVYIGHDSYTSCYAMTRVSGTQYLWKLAKGWNSSNAWDGASGWVVCKEKWWDNHAENVYKFVYHGNNNVTNITASAWSNSNIYKTNGTTDVTHFKKTCTVYKLSSYTKSNYTVTINTVEGGTLTVKDYDNNTVTTGASKIHLTVLKFSASPASGYVFGGVQINDGSNTTTIAASEINTKTYTLTSAVTITPIWTAAETLYTVTVSSAGNGTVSPASVQAGTTTKPEIKATANTGYHFINWTTTGGASVANTNSATTTVTATATGTVTANFVANTYTVTFNANGGTGTMNSQQFTYNEAQKALTANTFTKEGAIFVGWAETASGNVKYTDGQKVQNLTTTNNGTVTLYAVWATIQIKSENEYYKVGGDKLKLQISYTNIPNGYYYRVYFVDKNGYYNGNANGENKDKVTISGDGNITFQSNATLPLGDNQTVVVELYNQDNQRLGRSNEITISVEQDWTINVDVWTNGQADVAGGTVTPTTVKPTAHIAEKVTAKANAGYIFEKWTVNTSNIIISDPTNATTTVTASAGGTVTAHFKEDLSSNYVVRGGAKFGNTWSKNDNKMTKKPGHSTESVVYYTLTLNETNTGSSANSDFQFKIYDTKNTQWWGLSTNDCTNDAYWYNRGTGEQTMANCANIDLRADVAGDYEIKVDYSNANSPKITVAFPSAGMSLVGSFNNWDENANLFTDNADDNTATATINLSAGEHQFKIKEKDTWRTSATTIERYSNNTDIDFTNTEGDAKNTTLKADIAGTYTFIYNKNKNTLTVQYPELTIYLYGEFNSWQQNDDYKFTEDADGKYILTKYFNKRERFESNQSQAEYEFKLNINGKNYTVEGSTDKKLLQYTRQNTTKVVNDGNDYTGPYYNLLLQADISGDYVFTYDPEKQQLSVKHPKYEPEASYIVGDFSDGNPGTDAMPKDGGGGKDWTEAYGKPFTNGVLDCIDFEEGTWNFKIKINGIWYGADIAAITTSGKYTLVDDYADTGEKDVTLTTNGEEGCYYFEYTLNDNGDLEVLIIFPNDKRTVTFDMQGHGEQVDEQHVLYNKTAVKPYVSDVNGYLFAGWYKEAACKNEYDFNTPVTEDITLYAKWIPYGDCVFFKNNLNWDEIYVYFYSSDKYWDDAKGTGSKKEKAFTKDNDTNHKPHYREFRGKMTRLGKTDIWYIDYRTLAYSIDANNWKEIQEYKNIAFTANKQDDYEYFDNTKVIRRGDFNPQMQLFIPQTDQTPTYLNKHNSKSTRYYNKGLWMKYNSTESGYNWSSNVGNWDNSKNYFTSEIAGGYSFIAEVELNAGSTYDFKIHNQNGTWYGNPGTMTQDNCTNWWFKDDVYENAKITPTVTGTYIFTAYLGDGKVIISLDYPLSTGDYRLAYKDNTAGSFHPGHYIKKRNTNKLDTVSFFIHHDKEPQVIAQRCTQIDAQGNATWATITAITINPAASITESGVYNFILEQIENESDPRLSAQATPYTGDYYIRTDAANGGWKSFRQAGNMMTYNSYADEHEDFDHYYCKWVDQAKGMKNVSYTVANDYSYCISDTLLKDVDTTHLTIVTHTEGNLPTGKSANVRWGWDSKTNTIRRAYMAGSGHKKDRFLVLEGNESLLDINGNRYIGNTAEGQDRYNLTDDEVVFEDMGNWIYQLDVKANKNTEIDLTALYDSKVQYFKGGSADGDELPLIVTTDDNNQYYKIRLIYDFKSNQLIIAWQPEGEVNTDELKVNMMIIRRNQDQAQQVNFKTGLTCIEKAYAVMTFDKYFLNNKNSTTGAALPQAEEKSANERKFYWVSFPFDVKLSDVTGFGEYGDYWIMEYYDGETRAKEGYWAETETFWKYITNKDYILKAGQGYVLYLNINKMKFESSVFANTSEVSLFFPSATLPKVITGELPTAVNVPAHTCTIERDDRNIYDSNWNLIGVPGFADITDVTIGDTHHKELNNEINADCVSFYYKYLPATNTYSATNQKETFQTMYAYMVQFAGTINWQAKTMPAKIAARRAGSMPSEYTLRLELVSGNKALDHTFVQLQDEKATVDYDLNLDLTKIMNSGANIYTLAGEKRIQMAGNTLPMEKATVPVGVKIAAAGEYTFRMPDGTEGISVILVDNATGTHTDMLLDDYTVTLEAGDYADRFYLVVDPNRTATSVENIGDEAKGVEKFLIHDRLIIRTVNGTFDAQGKRL